MTRPIIFSDLDDTIFQTARKMDGGIEQATLASEALNGSHSYLSGSQALMMDWLLASTRFIPVTARSTEALQRCTLTFEDYLVCSNGAVILMPDGTPDKHWLSKMKDEAEAAAGYLNDLLGFVQTKTAPGRFRCWIVEEFGTGFYFCVKSNEGADLLDELEDGLGSIAGTQLVRHRNDNNLSYTPAAISKRFAVEYLAQKLQSEPRVPVFGMGDSLTDLPFMATCDMLVIPKNSQIDREILHSERF
ncbi:MAG: hydroxymethylpyrimidine pyrophosphatase-like HAD family hydrolase [Granulosicoccus sp.]|jgi:hydroxymethylpyrimidine pyrophosphatase-like HAD family hydrolase